MKCKIGLGMQRGGIKVLTIVILLALAAGAYLFIKFAPVYYERFRIQQSINMLTRRAEKLSIPMLEKEIINIITMNGFDLKPEDFEIIEENGYIYIFVYYEREVNHPFGYVTFFQFDLEGKP